MTTTHPEPTKTSASAALRRPVDRPRFSAIAISDDDGEPHELALWCPWCEIVHSHGAGGGGGNRGAHCGQDYHSPLNRVGYDLDVVGRGCSFDAVKPLGLMVGERCLHRVLDQASGAIRAVVLRYILDVKMVRGQVLQKRVGKGKAWIFGAESWLVELKGRRPVEGQGFLRLAAALYGVSPGVAAVRFLEAITLDRLDAEAALSVQRVVDDWVARGAASRPSR